MSLGLRCAAGATASAFRPSLYGEPGTGDSGVRSSAKAGNYLQVTVELATAADGRTPSDKQNPILYFQVVTLF